jgi:glucoamylase
MVLATAMLVTPTGQPAAAAAPSGPAPGAPGEAATFAPGDKDGFGTAIDAPRTKVWYTLNDGALSEVYYPRIDTPGSRDTQLVVSDGATFTDREDADTYAPLAWTHAGFIRLAWGIDTGRPMDTPRVVACRYRTTLCR